VSIRGQKNFRKEAIRANPCLSVDKKNFRKEAHLWKKNVLSPPIRHLAEGL